MAKAKELAEEIAQFCDANIVIEGRHDPDAIAYVSQEAVDRIELMLIRALGIE